MKRTYLVLAILGGIIPYLFFAQFISLEGLNLILFIESLFINGAAGGFSADLLFTSFVFWLFMFHQAKGSSGPSPYLFIGINLTIGLSCALPAYLYAREVRENS
jgi:hypothetical protein